ncbi:hypothetical protein A9Q83_07615 [Alphaproteobacteria bacterium 46_93_T64]|nr:hypothetical protein A9Q83_07615 [Alphaproteobacteria bacterium 46_93_T64]
MTTCAVCNTEKTIDLVQQNNFFWQKCEECNYAFLLPDYKVEDDLDVLSTDRGNAYIDFYGKKFKSKMKRARKRATSIKKHAKGKQVLDVGCNLGYFVEACRELNMQALGVEVSQPVVDQAKQYFPKSEFICDFLENIDFEDRRFDVVYTSEVIEHVPDVNGFMSCIAKNMNKGGVLYLTTPELKRYKSNSETDGWENLHAPNHRQYFSKDNMVSFLEKHGFENIKFVRNWNFKTGIKLLAFKK